MTINKNKWIYCIICRFILSRWLEAQHAAPLLTWYVQQINSMKSVLNELSIVHCQLSIALA